MTRPNIYAMFCPCCGAAVCGKCGQYADRLEAGGDSELDRRWRQGVARAWRRHREEYEHDWLDKPGSAVVMRLEIPEPVHTVMPNGAHHFDFTGTTKYGLPMDGRTYQSAGDIACQALKAPETEVGT